MYSMLPALHLSPINVTEIYMYLYKLTTTSPAQAVISLHRYHTLHSTAEDASTQLPEKPTQIQTPIMDTLKTKVNLAFPHLL